MLNLLVAASGDIGEFQSFFSQIPVLVGTVPSFISTDTYNLLFEPKLFLYLEFKSKQLKVTVDICTNEVPVERDSC